MASTVLLLRQVTGQKIVVDWRDAAPGDKQYHWEQRGVPFRIEVGPRDVQRDVCVLKRRLDRGKETIALADLSPAWLVPNWRKCIPHCSKRRGHSATRIPATPARYDEMKTDTRRPWWICALYFEPDKEAEAKIKAETKATVRCIPFDQPAQPGKCVYSGRETATRVLFAQAY